MAFLPFEVQHRIHDMFKCARPGDRPIFRHMTDQERRGSASFREEHHLGGHLLHLTDASRGRREVAGKGRLNRVDDQGRGSRFGRRFQDFFKVRLRQDQQCVRLNPQPLTAHFDLTRGLLARDVQDLFGPVSQLWKDLQ